MELERISNDLEHANTVQERKGIKEFRKTILDYTKRNMCTKSPYYAWMYKDARTKNPILAKFLHETHYEENDDEGEWYMTDDNWRYFKEFAGIMSDIEAARRR
jgi:nuclear transport factor 2 (NTF2) superfamily protein